MSRGFVALNEGITVQQAIDYLRVLRPPSDRAYYLYVVDTTAVSRVSSRFATFSSRRRAHSSAKSPSAMSTR